jgi:hypothetical protein
VFWPVVFHVGSAISRRSNAAWSSGYSAHAVELEPDGTHVGYLDPRELAGRCALDGHEQTLER